MAGAVGLWRVPKQQGATSTVKVVPSAGRALAVLTAFRHGDGPLSLAELAERTGLAKSTIMRLAVSLQAGRSGSRVFSGCRLVSDLLVSRRLSRPGRGPAQRGDPCREHDRFSALRRPAPARRRHGTAWLAMAAVHSGSRSGRRPRGRRTAPASEQPGQGTLAHRARTELADRAARAGGFAPSRPGTPKTSHCPLQ